MKHETWRMDPYRPGPTKIFLDNSMMGAIHSADAILQKNGQWRLESDPAVMRLPVLTPDAKALSHSDFMDAIWRLRFSVMAPVNTPRSCRKVHISFSDAHPMPHGFRVDQTVNVKIDGDLHTYAIFGNNQLRPVGGGHMEISFAGPPGTQVTWCVAERLGVATPQSARAFIQDGTPINPYRKNDPQ